MRFYEKKGNVVLAPMAGISLPSFRLLCRDYGSSFSITEMVSANALARNNSATEKLTGTTNDEKPVGLQLFGQNEENLIRSAQEYEKKFDFIDINMGCPADKIVRQGAGSALLKRPQKIKKIVSEISSTIKIPLSVKIRHLPNQTVKIADMIEKEGASFITVHGRTAPQGYYGKANWNIIKEVKQSVSIPVYGNGDVTGPLSCEKMMKETGCDSVMIGRVARGNPFIFKQCREYLDTGKVLENQTFEQRMNDFLKLVEYNKKIEGENIVFLKQQLMYFTKGFEGARKLRNNLSKISSREELLKSVKENL